MWFYSHRILCDLPIGTYNTSLETYNCLLYPKKSQMFRLCCSLYLGAFLYSMLWGIEAIFKPIFHQSLTCYKNICTNGYGMIQGMIWELQLCTLHRKKKKTPNMFHCWNISILVQLDLSGKCPGIQAWMKSQGNKNVRIRNGWKDKVAHQWLNFSQKKNYNLSNIFSSRQWHIPWNEKTDTFVTALEFIFPQRKMHRMTAS